jgi:transposase-like protein
MANKGNYMVDFRAHVLAGSALFTDALKSYDGLDEFQHEVVDQRGRVRSRRSPTGWKTSGVF